ncbi:hypothetical protein L9F63_008629 [Diploptera punctata]|uniref:Cytochrome P450 n=1 Tax=Diploptera punctata TaxID=6984 RepID=A0AAD7Z4Z7_DIPPU|nr:hypothetical protein L9F63_008629 [Diploptera punctata]
MDRPCTVPMLFLRDPRDIEIILRSEIRNVKKSFPYYILGQLMGDGLTILEGNKWEVHRKLLDPAFHLKFLENSVKIFARESEILIQKLEKEIGQQSFDVKTYFNRVIVNIVTKDVTILDEEGVNECIEKLQQAHKLFMLRAMSPWLYPDFIYWRTSNGRKSKEIIEFSKKLAQDISNCKREKLAREKKSRTANVEGELLGKKKMPTFLDLLLNATDYGVQLSEKDINNEIRTFIVAAFDTVNVTLCWLMQVLGNHLEIQDKVYEEIENVLHGSNRLITMKDLNEMNYLERVIKEVQRLHSPVPLLSRTITKDLEIGGHTVPEGMIINIPTCQVHKNPEIYQNPEKFDPDRFLQSQKVIISMLTSHSVQDLEAA